MMLSIFLLFAANALLNFSLTLAAAGQPIARVVSTSETLEDVANHDVNALTVVNGLTEAPRIPEDLQNLVADFQDFTAADQGSAGTSDPGTEDTVTDSFNALSSALATLMNDLIEKKDTLTLYGQQNATYTQLQALRNASLDSAELIAPLVEDSDHREEINEITTDGLGPIEDAEEEFEPDETL